MVGKFFLCSGCLMGSSDCAMVLFKSKQIYCLLHTAQASTIWAFTSFKQTGIPRLASERIHCMNDQLNNSKALAQASAGSGKLELQQQVFRVVYTLSTVACLAHSDWVSAFVLLIYMHIHVFTVNKIRSDFIYSDIWMEYDYIMLNRTVFSGNQLYFMRDTWL